LTAKNLREAKLAVAIQHSSASAEDRYQRRKTSIRRVPDRVEEKESEDRGWIEDLNLASRPAFCSNENGANSDDTN
jgi:hypothetical protein